MDKRSAKAWLYLLPALVFLGVFMVYPLIDVFIYSFEEGYGAMLRLLNGDPITAVFAMSDVMALGAIRALADAGKRVPEDISVVGFDGLQIGEFTLPRLSTVSQSVEQLVERSMNLLLEGIETGMQAKHEVVPVRLMLRESVREL